MTAQKAPLLSKYTLRKTCCHRGKPLCAKHKSTFFAVRWKDDTGYCGMHLLGMNEQWKNQAHSLSPCWVTLDWRLSLLVVYLHVIFAKTFWPPQVMKQNALPLDLITQQLVVEPTVSVLHVTTLWFLYNALLVQIMIYWMINNTITCFCSHKLIYHIPTNSTNNVNLYVSLF